jgi:hypothetical protein
MDPIHGIDPARWRDLDPVAAPVRLTPVERELERERREQARKKRRRTTRDEGRRTGPDADGHIDLTA